MSVPRNVAEISAEWMEEILSHFSPGLRVERVDVRPIGENVGFLSCVAVIGLTYAVDSADGPASVVVKLEPEAGTFRDTERELGAFEREIRFYRDAGDGLDMRLAKVFHAECTPEGSFLAMEDLSHLNSGDQVRGMLHEEVLATVRQIGRLHAAYWNNDSLKSLDWAPDHERFWIEGFAEHWPVFAREYEVRLGADGLALGDGIANNLEWLEQRVAERPSALIHSDLRADNIMFGQPHSADAAVIVDWQLVTKTMAAIDPTRLFCGSEPAAQRKGHHMDVFTAWHDTLLRYGVEDYDFEEAMEDFRLGVLFNILVPIKAHSFLTESPTIRGMRLHDATTERMFVSAAELDVISLLPRGK